MGILFFLMEVIELFNNFFYLNFVVFLLGLYILNSLCFNIFFNSARLIGCPPILNTATNFSMYICSLIFLFIISNLTETGFGIVSHESVFNNSFLIILFCGVIATLITSRDFFLQSLAQLVYASLTIFY